MCLWASRSASSAAYDRTRLLALVKGRSTLVDVLGRISVRSSICLRMSARVAFLMNLSVSCLSARKTPSSRCSGSM